jgi:hypothetical protein
VEIESDISVLLFGNAKIGKPSKEMVTLKNATAKPITLLQLLNPYSNLKIRFQKTTLKANEEVMLDAEYTPTEPGIVSGEVRIMTDSDRQRNVRLPFSVSVPWEEGGKSTNTKGIR